MKYKGITALESRFLKACDGIKNIEPTKIKELWEKYKHSDFTAFVPMGASIREELGLIKPLNRLTKDYWLLRGWSERDTYFKLKECKEAARPRLSPFSREFWMLKGLSEEEADFKRNSMRPIRKEYWMLKGLSEEEAIIKAKESKSNNNAKGAKNAGATKKSYMNPTSIDYWTGRGCTEEEAQEKLRDRQTTFTLEKCIAKYGKHEGTRRFHRRQTVWQDTLRAKSKPEIDEINRKKSCINLSKIHENFDGDASAYFTHLNETRNIVIHESLSDFNSHIESLLEDNPCMKYWPPHKMLDYFSKLQIDHLALDERYFEKYSVPAADNGVLMTAGKFVSYRKWVDEGLLRSAYEIEFYNMIRDRGIRFELDKCYPGSSLRFDFYLLDYNIYIEICPLYDVKGMESYTAKMDAKASKHDATLLKHISEYDPFLETINLL